MGSWSYFLLNIATTDFATNDLKLVLDTESIDGYNQIDAIGIAEAASTCLQEQLLLPIK